MKSRIYVETTVISYLTALPSTWNCTHIANAAIRGKIERTCRDMGLEPPIICTPEELTEE